MDKAGKFSVKVKKGLEGRAFLEGQLIKPGRCWVISGSPPGNKRRGYLLESAAGETQR